MQMRRMASCALLMLGVAAAALGGCERVAQPAGTRLALREPTAEDAKAFVAKAEADLMKISEYAGRASWVMSNFITEDTEWLQSKANAEATTMASAYAREAARFNKVETDPI